MSEKPDQDAQDRVTNTFDGPATEDRTDEHENPSIPADTAFVVFVQDGEAYGVATLGPNVQIEKEGQVFDVLPGRTATANDMHRACSEVVKDIVVAQTASQTMQQMALYTAQMQAQMRDSKIAQQAGIQVPGR